ncbi:hypothetical protein FDECE_12918 [Fusarium decemcellulare]|nr:hypothetical protein FDECE_12918 [Fusarium decemcellulare]
MSSPTLCSLCSGIFQGQYALSNVLTEHGLLELEGAAFVPSGFATDEPEWVVRMDKGPKSGQHQAPYLHYALDDLVESTNSCALCAMIWERLQRDIHPLTLSRMREENLVGIPAILPKETMFFGAFTVGFCYVKVKNDKFAARVFHMFRVFKAINMGEGTNADAWKSKFDRAETLTNIKSWLESPSSGLSLSPRLPTRLLQCQPSTTTGQDPTVKLINTKELSLSTQYAALSHRWGEVQPLMLLRRLEDAFNHDIPFTSIPATFQDAIRLANALGIHYMWIDSLCIIQDSKEDWEAEAAHMASVYSQAYVTISATAAKDSSAGLKQDSMLKHPCEIVPTWTCSDGVEMPSGRFRLIDRSAFCDRVLSQPLFRRGWVFQEWILSPKTIHVARDQLWWTSASNMKTEGFASNETCNGYSFDVNQEFAHTMPLGTLYSMGKQNVESLRPVWHLLLQDYMSRSFTFESDRLIAFAGIASLYRALARVPPDSYLAGIWRQSLLRDLLWTVRDGRKVSPPQHYRVPSWSWASAEPTHTGTGKFGIGNINLNADLEEDEESWTPAATVLDASVTTTGPEFGFVFGGHLILQGPLIKARLSLELIDLSDRFTPQQAAEFLPGGTLRYVQNLVFLPTSPGVDMDEADLERAETKAQLDDIEPPFLSEKEITIYLAVLHCRVDMEGGGESHALVLVRGLEKGEYRRIGYVQLQEDVMSSWIQNRDFGVFDSLEDENEYLSRGEKAGYYAYRIV